ncbi:MAG: hypothetical protein ABSD64_05105 [Terriglobales bacterium]|jgi:hypothetical protein
MSKLRIEHGASKINWVTLKTNIEESIATDIDRMCQWSNNERKYVVNELLRFALAQSEGFQRYKADSESTSTQTTIGTDSIPVASRSAAEPPVKSVAPATPTPKHP